MAFSSPVNTAAIDALGARLVRQPPVREGRVRADTLPVEAGEHRRAGGSVEAVVVEEDLDVHERPAFTATTAPRPPPRTAVSPLADSGGTATTANPTSRPSASSPQLNGPSAPLAVRSSYTSALPPSACGAGLAEGRLRGLPPNASSSCWQPTAYLRVPLALHPQRRRSAPCAASPNATPPPVSVARGRRGAARAAHASAGPSPRAARASSPAPAPRAAGAPHCPPSPAHRPGTAPRAAPPRCPAPGPRSGAPGRARPPPAERHHRVGHVGPGARRPAAPRARQRRRRQLQHHAHLRQQLGRAQVEQQHQPRAPGPSTPARTSRCGSFRSPSTPPGAQEPRHRAHEEHRGDGARMRRHLAGEVASEHGLLALVRVALACPPAAAAPACTSAGSRTARRRPGSSPLRAGMGLWPHFGQRVSGIGLPRIPHRAPASEHPFIQPASTPRCVRTERGKRSQLNEVRQLLTRFAATVWQPSAPAVAPARRKCLNSGGAAF